MKKIILAIITLSLCFSCGVHHWVNIDTRMKNAQLGMSKQEIINAVGKDYQIASSYRDNYGDLVEVLSYSSRIEEYKLIFVNNKLAEWDKVYIPHHHHHHPDSNKEKQPDK